MRQRVTHKWGEHTDLAIDFSQLLDEGEAVSEIALNITQGPPGLTAVVAEQAPGGCVVRLSGGQVHCEYALDVIAKVGGETVTATYWVYAVGAVPADGAASRQSGNLSRG